MLWLLSAFLLTILLIIYNGWRRSQRYWKDKGVSGPRPLPIVGNMLKTFLRMKSVGEACTDWSQEFENECLVGLHYFVIPSLMLNSVEYVETVMKKEFSHFTDRKLPSPSNVNNSDQFLMVMTGKVWKALRYKLSPVFTSGKIKGMVPLMSECFQHTLNTIDNNLSDVIDSENLIEKYIIDSTAKIVYGIELSDLSNPKCEFFHMCHDMFKFSWKRFISFVIYMSFPRLAYSLNIAFAPTKYTAYFQNIIDETFKRRREMTSKRNDFVQLLMELKDKGSVHIEAWEDEDNYLKTEKNQTLDTIEITDSMLSSQAIIFLITGFETMGPSLTFTLLELTQNERAMTKLIDEIDRVMMNHKDFTCDALKEMKYLEMCIKEGMRLHPVLPTLNRICTKNFTFCNGVQIEKGLQIFIPVLAIHLNPTFYPDPTKFNPERFIQTPTPGSYLPFGDGPRVCIASRFAMIQMKLVIARLLHSYEIRLSSKTQLPVKTEKYHFMLKLTSHVYFTMRKRVHPLVRITFN